MGVCCVCYAISDANLTAVLADPLLVWRIVEAEDNGAYLRALQKSAKPSTLSRLLGKPPPAIHPKQLTFIEGEMRSVDLDKSWDGLRACLEICAPEAPDFFDAKGQVGDVDVGYGPALFHRPDAIARMAAAYANLTGADILEAYGQVNLEKLYPRGLWQRHDTEVAGYLTENFAYLQPFIQHADDHSLGVVIQYT